MRRDTPTNKDDTIDLRDVIERFEELEGERDGLAEELEDAQEARKFPDDGADIAALDEAESVAHAALDNWTQDNGEEFKQLQSLLEDLKGYGGDEQWRGDWYPVSLIRDSYFETYAEELADELGAINSNATWPNNCIDWARAARELQQDYSTVEFDGVTYWYR